MQLKNFFRRETWRRWRLITGAACLLAVVAVFVLTRGPSLPPNAGTVARLRLMTGEQFANSIAYIFGSDIKAGTAFAPLQRTDGLLALGAASVGVTTAISSSIHLEMVQVFAEHSAQPATLSRTAKR